MMIMGKKRIISVEIATQSKIRLLLDHSQEPTVEKLLNQRAQKQTSKDKEGKFIFFQNPIHCDS